MRCSDRLGVVVKQYVFRRPHVEDELERLHTYLTALASLNHPSLPVIFDQFQSWQSGSTSQWVVRSFVPGDSMETILQRHQFLQAEVVRFLFEMADVLQHLHLQQTPPIVHGALKPRHIIRPEGRRPPVLIDFAMPGAQAVAIENARGAEQGYRAAELQRGTWSPAADIYALGATSLRLLTRREPAGLLDGSGRVAQRSLEHLAESTVDLLDRMMSPEPEERIYDGGDLRAYLDSSFLTSGLPRRHPRRPRPSRSALTGSAHRLRRRLPAGLTESFAGAALLFALGAGVFAVLTLASTAPAPVADPTTAAATRTCFGQPNLLVDPGFEEQAVAQGLPKKTGLWSGDLTEVVGRQAVLQPVEGLAMLAFRATRPGRSSPTTTAKSISSSECKTIPASPARPPRGWWLVPASTGSLGSVRTAFFPSRSARTRAPHSSSIAPSRTKTTSEARFAPTFCPTPVRIHGNKPASMCRGRSRPALWRWSSQPTKTCTTTTKRPSLPVISSMTLALPS